MASDSVVRDKPWNRAALVAEVRDKIWRYLTPAAKVEQMMLEAAALLDLPLTAIVQLAELQYLVSDELGDALDSVPRLLRRFASTTVSEFETSPERVRGRIEWGQTLSYRAATGLKHVYVSAPARRAYDTPENQLLAFVLSETPRLARNVGWGMRDDTTVAGVISHRSAAARRWLSHRMISEVSPQRPTARGILRIRQGRRRQYQPVLKAYDLYVKLLGTSDRQYIRQVVEQRAIVACDPAQLFEILVAFGIIDVLERENWTHSPLHLVRGALTLTANRNQHQLQLFFQRLSKELLAISTYVDVQRRHGIHATALRPDLVLRFTSPQGSSWLLVEVKGGSERGVAGSIRDALSDLLAYGRDYAQAVKEQPPSYGLGVAWGDGLEADLTGPLALCTQEQLPETFSALLKAHFDHHAALALEKRG
jgi:hypothetical protein